MTDKQPSEPIRDPRIIGDQPLDVAQLMRIEKGECLQCRVVGSLAFMGLGGYTYWSGMRQINQNADLIRQANTRFGIGVRRIAITGLAGTMITLGFVRLATYRW